MFFFSPHWPKMPLNLRSPAPKVQFCKVSVTLRFKKKHTEVIRDDDGHQKNFGQFPAVLTRENLKSEVYVALIRSCRQCLILKASIPTIGVISLGRFRFRHSHNWVFRVLDGCAGQLSKASFSTKHLYNSAYLRRVHRLRREMRWHVRFS